MHIPFTCKHDWKIFSETLTESRLEHCKNNNFNPARVTHEMLTRKHIQIITCNKCGKLKRFVEEI